MPDPYADLNASQKLYLQDAVEQMVHFFDLNPFRYGKMHGFEGGKKHLTTIDQKLTTDLIAQHLLSGTENDIHKGIGRLGWLSTDSTGQKTKLGTLDIDGHDAESALMVDALCMAIDAVCRELGVPVYRELTINRGWHIYVAVDDYIELDEMQKILYLIKFKARAAHLETYPMGTRGAQGRWVFYPGAGAMSPLLDPAYNGRSLVHEDPRFSDPVMIRHTYGRTYLESMDGEPISVLDYSKLPRLGATAAVKLAKMGATILDRERKPKKIGKDSYDPTANDIAPTDSNLSMFRDNVTKTLPKSFGRHDALMSWVNIARRMSRVDDCVEVLKSHTTYEAWIKDGSRTFGTWCSEIDRIVDKFTRFGTDEYGFEFGISHLRTTGWKVSDFAKIEPESGMEKEGKQSTNTLARRFLEDVKNEDRPIIYLRNGDTFRQYNGRFYRKMSTEGIIKAVYAWYDELFGQGSASALKIKNIIEEIKIQLHSTNPPTDNPDYITCLNGKIKMTSHPDSLGNMNLNMEFIEHTSEIISFGMVYAVYNEDMARDYVNSPVYQVLDRTFWYEMDEVERGNKIKTIIQYLGYALSGDTKVQKMLNLHGASGVGKSTVIRLFKRLNEGTEGEEFSVPEEESTHGPLQFAQLGNDHMLSGLETRRSLFISEVSSREAGTRSCMVMLKALVGGDSININPKGKASYPHTPKTKIICSSNTEFQMGEDRTNGSITRRLIRVPIERELPPELIKSEHQLNYEMMGSQDKLDHSFSAMMYFFKELVRDDYNFRYYDHKAIFEPVARADNPIITFLETMTVPVSAYGPDMDVETAVSAVVRSTNLMQVYNRWAEDSAEKPYGQGRWFTRDLMEALRHLKWMDLGVGHFIVDYHYITGLYIKNSTLLQETSAERQEILLSKLYTQFTPAKLKAYAKQYNFQLGDLIDRVEPDIEEKPDALKETSKRKRGKSVRRTNEG